MKRVVIGVLMVVTVLSSGLVFGAAMQDIIYQGDKATDEVVFHGDQHLKRGFKCDDCHNKGMFPEKKKGATVISRLLCNMALTLPVMQGNIALLPVILQSLQ